MGPKPRGAPPARTAWSYGPGVGMGGFGMNNVSGRSSSGGGEVVGPRISSTVRRPSGNSNASAGSRTPAGDEASSTASSSTSSSSRKTYTSTTSSQHPLPARPDWAVGLKPQPTLHSTHARHHDHSMGSRNMSPARNNGQRGQQAPPPLQSTDFPPLSSITPATEKRMPVAGVWNSSSTRSILMPGNNNNTPSNALVSHSDSGTGTPSNGKSEESEGAHEQPPPKGGVEVFNPKGAWRPGGGPAHSRSPVPQDRADKDKFEKERLRGEVVANAILVDKLSIHSVEDKDGGGAVNAAAKGVAPVALAT
ncbi:hypothetical protein HYDPIDRAFT_88485 [Hydnomerulius pinastri MD-312]|nr:hypothetical protein HYDPIDRAFT_88485 [Hydnomerulius pinastri MD-312]